MLSTAVLALAVLPLALAQSNETVLGVYMFHRHGDRTAKATPPTNLTAFGYQEVVTSGQYYRNRYIASNATYPIHGISSDLVVEGQLMASAPLDTVLQNSAMGFLQGLYPPVGSTASAQTLRNGTVVDAPLGGYQLIPVDIVSSGTGSEDATWLQSTTGCGKATIASNNYFSSTEYMDLLNSTHDFYQDILPVINGSFNASTDTFKNAYTIFDLVNVAEIHNATINSSDLITPDVFFQLRTLADTHEWNLAYNSSDTIVAVAGMTLAGQIVQFLNATITAAGGQSFGIQFGTYSVFSSFFGLADLQLAAPDLYGVADYASAMTFEMFTNSSTPVSKTSYPSADEIFVRFYFHNGTTSDSSPPVVYPLFNSGQDTLSWADFSAGINKFAIGDTQQWCTACGNTTGTCAQYSGDSSSSGSSASPSSSSSSGSGNGLSPAVNGVIGAMVTLAVVLALEGLVMLIAGLRLVSKKRLAQNAAVAGSSATPKA